MSKFRCPASINVEYSVIDLAEGRHIVTQLYVQTASDLSPFIELEEIETDTTLTVYRYRYAPNATEPITEANYDIISYIASNLAWFRENSTQLRRSVFVPRGGRYYAT